MSLVTGDFLPALIFSLRSLAELEGFIKPLQGYATARILTLYYYSVRLNKVCFRLRYRLFGEVLHALPYRFRGI